MKQVKYDKVSRFSFVFVLLRVCSRVCSRVCVNGTPSSGSSATCATAGFHLDCLPPAHRKKVLANPNADFHCGCPRDSASFP
ncbi:unnamed protein product [Boreogadus saida]